MFSDYEQLLTQPDVDVVAITVKVPHHPRACLRPHWTPAKPSTANGRLSATSTIHERWPRSRPSRERLPSSGCRPAKPWRSSSSSSCSATDTLARSCQQPWWGCRSQATSGASPTPTCSTRQRGQPAHDRSQPRHPHLCTGRIHRPVSPVGSSQTTHHHRRDRGADRENGGRPNRDHRHPHLRSKPAFRSVVGSWLVSRRPPVAA